MRGEQLFLTNLELIERAAAFVARRAGLSTTDAEDLSANVKVKLIENDYAVLEKFEERCSLPTYIVAIAHRLLANDRMHVYGRWRPSAEAKRLGETAVMLETLLVRDGLPLEEAVRVAERADPGLTLERAEEIAKRLPERAVRARLVPIESDLAPEVAPETVEERVADRDRAVASDATSRVVRASLAKLPEPDRALLRLRFDGGMRISDIARALACEQKPLYRRLDAIIARLHDDLVKNGIDAETARDLVGGATTNLDFGMNDGEKSRSRQTLWMRRGRHEEQPPP